MRHESQYDYKRGYGQPREHQRWNQPDSMHPYDENRDEQPDRQQRGQIRQGWDNDLREAPRSNSGYRASDEPRARQPSGGGYGQPYNTGYRQQRDGYGSQRAEPGFSRQSARQTWGYGESTQQGYGSEFGQPQPWQAHESQQNRPDTYDAARYDRGQEYASGTRPTFAQGGDPRQDQGPGGTLGATTYRPTGSQSWAAPGGYPGSTQSQSRTEPYAGHVPRGAMPHTGVQPGWGQGASGGFGGSGVSHAGRGPKNYTRSDDRLEDEVNDILTRDHHLDASDIEVSVSDGEVTLTGAVCCRSEKFHAEQLADSITGVKDITNKLRVDRTRDQDSDKTDTDKRSPRMPNNGAGSSPKKSKDNAR